MKLFIAEKPSMAKEIANVVSEISNVKIKKNNGYFTIGDNIITWQFGHLLELKSPEQIDEIYKQWNFNTLPIIPKTFEKIIKKNCIEQFNIIKSLVSNNKVSTIIHAGDPDREGELLIRETLYKIKNQKPVKRILLNALDSKSIKLALTNLKDDAIFDNLYKSAEARCEADWLIGMNLSRAYTLLMNRAGYDKVINIGRVMTPTMCLVVNRENEINIFKPTTHYKLEATFRHQNGLFKTKLNSNDLANDKGYILDKQVLINIQNDLVNINLEDILISKYEVVLKKERQRLPYSLSKLQIEAGKKYGYSPQKVLDICQELYEKKLTTYPRSDCDYLPQNQFDNAYVILENLKNEFPTLVKECSLDIKSPAWNDKKITAHHAIIPTTLKVNKSILSKECFNIYTMIALAYIAQFYPVHTYNQTNVEIKVLNKNYIFTTTGKTILDIGWRKLYSFSDDNEKKENLIPLCNEGDKLIYLTSNIIENITKPPKRFTTSSLLEAMKNINKYVVNPKYKQLLKTTSGIGTEATRAGIIDKLIDKGFLELNKNNLYPTKISIYLNNILPKGIKEPDLTAIWEDWLTQINEGTLDVNKFNHNQIALIKNAIDFTKTLKIKSFNESSYSCPYCNSSLRLITLKDKSKIWICLNKDNCKKGFFSNLNNKPVLISCPNCKTGYLKKRKGSKGYFWSCDNYPTCKTTFSDKNGKPAIK